MASLTTELFDPDFWRTGWAIVRYIPRSLRVTRVEGLAFFSKTKRDELRDRVSRITPQKERRWGTMTVAQMVHHLNLACGGSLGFYELPDESYFLSRHLFRWILVDWFSEQPVGLRRPSGFRLPPDAKYDLEFERQRLLQILEAAWNARSAADWGPHPMFGPMTPEQWGKLLQIHVDYHLRQFSA